MAQHAGCGQRRGGVFSVARPVRNPVRKPDAAATGTLRLPGVDPGVCGGAPGAGGGPVAGMKVVLEKLKGGGGGKKKKKKGGKKK